MCLDAVAESVNACAPHRKFQSKNTFCLRTWFLQIVAARTTHASRTHRRESALACTHATTNHARACAPHSIRLLLLLLRVHKTMRISDTIRVEMTVAMLSIPGPPGDVITRVCRVQCVHFKYLIYEWDLCVCVCAETSEASG